MITKPVQVQKYAFSIKDPLFKETIDIVGWSVEDCDWFIPHQTSERAMKKAQRLYEAYLGVPFKRPLSSVVGLYGNTSSTSHMLVLHDKILNDGIDEDDKLIFIIGASGIVAGYAAYTIDDLPARYRAQFEKKEEQKYA
jgi:3-oxoacyl-[acyl-carrier-protein] synthase III